MAESENPRPIALSPDERIHEAKKAVEAMAAWKQLRSLFKELQELHDMDAKITAVIDGCVRTINNADEKATPEELLKANQALAEVEELITSFVNITPEQAEQEAWNILCKIMPDYIPRDLQNRALPGRSGTEQLKWLKQQPPRKLGKLGMEARNWNLDTSHSSPYRDHIVMVGKPGGAIDNYKTGEVIKARIEELNKFLDQYLPPASK